jgi:hypothetical protein
MSIYDDIQAIECRQCRAFAIEDIAELVTDPKNLAKLDAEEAEEVRQYLGKLLNKPDNTLKQLVRALASKAKASVGAYEQ